MSESTLFAIGCGVFFLAFGGIYTFVRERFLDGTPRQRHAPAREAGSVALNREPV